MSLEENEILIRSEEGAYLPVLDIMHKVTAGASGGSVKIEEWGLPPGEMIPSHPCPRGRVLVRFERQDDVLRRRRDRARPRRLIRNQAAGRTPRLLQFGRSDRTGHGDPHAGWRVRRLLRRVEEIVSRQMSEEEHRRARADLGERYGITWHDERIPEVEASFGISS